MRRGYWLNRLASFARLHRTGVAAQVTQAVYDSPTGKYLLIPQGAKLVGQYELGRVRPKPCSARLDQAHYHGASTAASTSAQRAATLEDRRGANRAAGSCGRSESSEFEQRSDCRTSSTTSVAS